MQLFSSFCSSWIAPTPHDVIWQRRSVKLLRYRSPARVGAVGGGREGPRYRLPLLVVPSMINRHYVMDLMPGRSLVEHLLAQGLEVYLLDWGRPRQEDQYVDFDSVILEMLGGAVERVCRRTGAEGVSLFGYCMGGTMAAIYTALRPRRVANLINLAGPVDFSKGDALFNWTDRRWFKPALLVDALGNLPPSLMQSSFSWLVPTANANKLLALIDRGGDEEFVRSFVAVETWTNDNVAFPGVAYRKYIEDLFQKNLLVQGEYRVRGERVDLGQISCPVLVLTASKDHIVPAPTAVPLVELCGAEDRTALELPGGHVGIMVGGGVEKHLWPRIDEWVLPRSAAVPRAGRAA